MISINVFYYAVRWHHWWDYLMIRYEPRTSSNVYYHSPPFLPHSTIIHGMGWNASQKKKCKTIFFFFFNYNVEIRPTNFGTHHRCLSWWLKANIFNGMSVFTNVMFCNPAARCSQIFHPKYTKIKQLWLSASATIILTRAAGTEKLISQLWQIKEAVSYLGETYFSTSLSIGYTSFHYCLLFLI